MLIAFVRQTKLSKSFSMLMCLVLEETLIYTNLKWFSVI